MRDMACLTVSRDPIEPYVLRRGLVFADGKRLLQVERFRDLNSTENAYWVEHNGLTIHLRLAGDQNPADHLIELTNKEQVFAPEKTGLGYIAVKGITFEQVGNGNPVPQIGAVSSGIGHHFVFENCVIRQVNGTGMDVGNQDWSLIYPAGEFSSHIIRRCFLKRLAFAVLLHMKIMTCWSKITPLSGLDGSIPIMHGSPERLNSTVLRIYCSGEMLSAICTIVPESGLIVKTRTTGLQRIFLQRFP